MNWIKQFSKLEKIYVDGILDFFIRFIEIKEQKFFPIYTRAYNLLYETNSTKIKNVEERLANNEKEWCEIIGELPGIGENLGKEFNKFEKEMRVLEREFIKKSVVYVNRGQLPLYQKRCNVLRNKIEIMIKSMHDNYAEELVDILMQILHDTGKLVSESDKKKYEIIQEEDKKIQYKKIFDYKEMQQLALDYGYEKVRTTGDHMMYKHIKTNKLVPIVAHEIQTGLSRQIQKQLYRNSRVD